MNGDDERPAAGPFAEALARLAGEPAPEVVDDAIVAVPRLIPLLAPIDGDRLAAWLAGLLTLPRLQANADRLEWAVRLALGNGASGRAPRRRDLLDLLNAALPEARVQYRDDPVEDFFIAPVLTDWGEFRTFPGRWDGALTSTEDMISAFMMIPDWGGKRDVLAEVLNLLKLGDHVAERSRFARRELGDGAPWNAMDIPSEDRLRQLAARVKFRPQELAELGIEASSLAPFVLHDRDRPSLLSKRGGDTPLEMRPLIRSGDGVLLAQPGALTTAVRGRLVAAAAAAGLLDDLHRSLFLAQARRIDETGYVRLPPPRRRTDGVLLRESALELSPGRILHFVHVTSGFEGWPIAAFGSVVAMSETWQRAVRKTIDDITSWAETSHPGAEVLTLLIAGGWGGGRWYDLGERPNWNFVRISPEDVETLSVLEDAAPEDLFRLQKQLDKLRGLGFEIVETNGLMNMIAWWHRSGHVLLPDDALRVESPQTIIVPIEMVLAARREAADLLDARALPRPVGPHLRCVRSEPRPAAGAPRSTYVASGPLAARVLMGAAVGGDECWWLDLEDSAPTEATRETWKAAINWLGIVMPAVIGEAGPAPILAIAMRLAVEWPNELMFDEGAADPWDLRVSERDDVRGPLLTIGAGWHRATARATNDAEIALAATLLVLAASLRDEELDAAHAAEIALRVAGSRDLRFRHAVNADGALAILAGHGLLPAHRPIPASAGALLKCGSAFLVRPPDEPPRIEGKGPCLDFLQAFVDKHRRLMLESVAGFERGSLVFSALSRFQAAMNEQRRWRLAAAALRAVHGTEADREASMDVIVRANGTLRASSLLAEIAASHAVLDKGVVAGPMDLDDLEARVLMLFVVEDAMAAIRLDRARALLEISPVGEVLFERDFERRTLQYASTVRHEEERERDVASYAGKFDRQDDDPVIDDQLASAVETEFGGDMLALVDMSFAPASLAIADRSDVTVMRRSELVERLEGLEPFVGKSLSAVVARLTLPCRSGWWDLPPGTKAADFDIARFDRRWSLSARPIVAIDQSHDPLVMMAPGVVQRSVLFNLGGIASGNLQGEFWSSRAMKRYAGRMGGETGMGFNDEVADAVRGLGLRAEVGKSVPWCRQTAGTPALIALGDVDVLAVSVDGRRVWVVEAKELKLCRTLGEAARRLSEYRGLEHEGGKPDKMLRHLRRVAHLREHADDLRRTLGLALVPEVNGVLVVGAPQPMEQAPANLAPDAKVVRIVDLGSVPWDRGWPAG